MSSPLHDFEILLRRAPASGTYLVSAHVAVADLRAEAEFRLPFDAATLRRAVQWMEQGRLDDDYVAIFGGQLFDALFAGTLLEVYDQNVVSGRRTRFRLIIDAPELVSVPWELLYDRQHRRFLALDGPFVRGISSTAATRPLAVAPPLRILVVGAQPRGVPQLSGASETGDLRRALSRAERAGRVAVRELAHATIESVQQSLRAASDPQLPRPFHVLHFIGHGERDLATGGIALLFEDADGNVDAVFADVLARVIEPYDLRLVFLNACRSAALDASALELAEGFAPSLLASGVPAVIGMQLSVDDSVARDFARRVYGAIADNQEVDVALADARRLARGRSGKGRVEMGTPVCYLRPESGQIMRFHRPERVALTRATWRPWLRQQATVRTVLGAVVGVFSVTATLLGLYTDVLPMLPSQRRMNGDLNIAVAAFTALDPDGAPRKSDAAEEWSDRVHALLQAELERQEHDLASAGTPLPLTIALWSPSRTGAIEGATAKARAERAADRAAAIDADVLVYGNLEIGSDVTRLAPQLFISDRKLKDAEELVDAFGFGAPIEARDDVDRNPVAEAALRDRLVRRIPGFARFVVGLGYYSLLDFPEALRHFKAAEATWRDEDASGKDILYLFLGNTAQQLGDADGSASYFRRAIDLNPGLARAQLGLAALRFQNSFRGCDPQRADVAGLRESLADYERALHAPDPSPLAQIPAKAMFGIGKVRLCLAQAGAPSPNDVDQWQLARANFEAVIALNGGGNARLKERAAESYANLGLIEIGTADPTDPAAAYRRALDAYGRAIELSRRDVRIATFSAYAAWLHLALHDCRAAEDALRAADAARVVAGGTACAPCATHDALRASVGALVDAAPGQGRCP